MTKPGNQPQLVDARYEAVRDMPIESRAAVIAVQPYPRDRVVSDIRFPQPDEHHCL